MAVITQDNGYSAIAIKQTDASKIAGGDQVLATLERSKMVHYVDTYTIPAIVTTTPDTWVKTIRFGPVPDGAIILPGSSFASDDIELVATVNYELGYTTYDDKGIAIADSVDIVDLAGNQLTDLNAFKTSTTAEGAIDITINALSIEATFVSFPITANHVYVTLTLTGNATGTVNEADTKLFLFMATV